MFWSHISFTVLFNIIINQRLLLQTHANLGAAPLLSLQQPLHQSLLPFTDGCQRGWFDGPHTRSFDPQGIHTEAFTLQPQSLSFTLSQGQEGGRTTPVNLLPAGAVIPWHVVHNVSVPNTLHTVLIKKISVDQSSTRSLVHRQIQEIKQWGYIQVTKKTYNKKNPSSDD